MVTQMLNAGLKRYKERFATKEVIVLDRCEKAWKIFFRCAPIATRQEEEATLLRKSMQKLFNQAHQEACEEALEAYDSVDKSSAQGLFDMEYEKYKSTRLTTAYQSALRALKLGEPIAP